MQLIIHRGAHQVGGNCVELNCRGSAILLDIGLPLDSNFDDDLESNLPQPLFDQIRHGTKRIDAVILSHAHMDHFGLAGMLPEGIPLYCSHATADLMDITSKIRPPSVLSVTPQFYKNREPFCIGPFSITACIIDHSAFDSYALLISMGGKSIFYTGDFRAHGRKAKTFEHLIKNSPHVDVLVMEGTMVGSRSNETVLTETELEKKFIQLIAETPGIVLVTASSQNIDRLVTIFKAAKHTQRRLIVDFYTAEVLERLGKYARIPQASWPRIRVCYPKFMTQRFRSLGLTDMLAKHHQEAVKWTRLQEMEDKVVMLIRPGFLWDIKKYLSLEGAAWVYSMWPGYLDKSQPLKKLQSYLQENGVRIEYLHTVVMLK